MKRVYLDYAATTPVDKNVEAVMRPFWRDDFGNPGSIHWFGQKASAAVFAARQKLAKALNCDYKEIIFTGSATEANNLALRGVFFASRGKITRPRLILSAVEHESLMDTAKALEENFGAEIVIIPVNKDGIVSVEKIKKSLNKNTVLVSVMYANNEIGTVQPVSEISAAIKCFKASRQLAAADYPLFHIDAVQAFQFLNCDVNFLGANLMTLSAHKIYGPKGAGALCANTINIEPIITGGGQEKGFRSGTENVAAIVGFGKAVEMAEELRTREFKRVKQLRNYLWKGIKKIIPRAEINGPDILGLSSARLPNNLNIYVPGKLAQDFCVELDLFGVSVSSGSACSARSVKPSAVIEALGYHDARSCGSIRLSLGRYTTKEEINFTLSIFKKVFK